MGRSLGLTAFSSNYEVNAAAPLDARTLVESVEDLTTAGTFGNYLYNGMLVSVSSDNSLWMLMDKVNITLKSSWKRVDAGSVKVNTYTKTVTANKSITVSKSEHNCGNDPVVRCYYGGSLCECEMTKAVDGTVTVEWNINLSESNPLVIVFNTNN